MAGIDERVIDEWVVEELGLKGKLVALEGAASRLEGVVHLVSKGCGAWVGRTICGERPVALLVGFRAGAMAYQSLNSFVVAVCRRHGPSLDELGRDLPRHLRRHGEREYRRSCRAAGIPVDDGVREVWLLNGEEWE